MLLKNVLIIKPSALGDVIQATAILPVIKNYNPKIKITWLVFEHNQEILAHHPLVDELLSISRRPLFSKKTFQVIRKLRQTHFDLVIDLQGLLRSAVISWLSGSVRRVGYADNREMSTLFYNEVYNIPASSMHAVDRYLLLMNKLGLPQTQEAQFSLPLKNQHRQFIRQSLNLNDDFLTSSDHASTRFITICPSAKWQSKCWPESYFVELICLLQQEKMKILLVGAPDEEEAIDKITQKIKRKNADEKNYYHHNNICSNLAGKLTLMEIAALLEISALFIGNDSGLMHLAAATNTPSVAIFGPTSPHKTGPYNKLANVINANLTCMPCFRKTCNNQRCMRLVTPSEVAKICLAKLKNSTS